MFRQSDETVGDAAVPDFDVNVAQRNFELSPEQQEAKDLILKWIDTKDQEFRLGGYAGTGKTTLIKELMSSFKGKIACGVAAFTGKAVAVLRRKGVPRTSTLHALLYDSEYDPTTKKIKWIKKTFLPYDLVIVDEASMVSTELYADLKAHDRVKLLFVGDPAQLEPVGDNPNLMRETDFVLTQIHRQAQGNPILRLARHVRNGNRDLPLGEWEGSGDNGKVLVTDSMYGLKLSEFDVVICAKNLTRHGINARYRALLDYDGDPQRGESVICLKNDKEHGVFNGMILRLDAVGRQTSIAGHDAFYADLSDDSEDAYYGVPIIKTFFGKDYKQAERLGKAVPFDYGYCLTAHKSQGSEWDRVLVLDEPLWKIDQDRWRYTAFSRAAKDLTVVLGR
jgi:exodeoxyribonuclease-5